MKEELISEIDSYLLLLSKKYLPDRLILQRVDDPTIGAGIDNKNNILYLSKWMETILTIEQLKCVMAHEIGHKLCDIFYRPKKLRYLILLGACILLTLSYPLWAIWEYFITHNMSIIEFYLIFSFILVFFVIAIIINIRNELNADLFAVTVTKDPVSLLEAIDSILKYMEENSPPKNRFQAGIERIKYYFNFSDHQIKLRRSRLELFVNNKNDRLV